MTAYVTIPDSDVDPESPITTALMTALRDNPLAIAERDATAPLVLADKVFDEGQFNGVKLKILNIGAWNMNSSAGGTQSVSVTHGLTKDDIRSVTALIIGDNNASRGMLEGTAVGGSLGGSINIETLIIKLLVTTGGKFDNTGFNELVGLDRGKIVIWYDS